MVGCPCQVFMRLLLFTKDTEPCRIVRDKVIKYFPETSVFYSDSNLNPFPIINLDDEIDFIISFLSPWIIPKNVLDKSWISINFHPAPIIYPGIGGYNFAIYNQDKTYGVTCHHMLPEVDSGVIIKTLTFPMDESDTVHTLKEKTMKYLLKLFNEIFDCIIKKIPLPLSKETWPRDPYTRKDLINLCEITATMREYEITRRIKATYFPDAKDLPFIKLANEKFILSR